MVARDDDDDDEHQDQQPSSRRPHYDHLHLLVHFAFAWFCAAWKRGVGGLGGYPYGFSPRVPTSTALSSTCQDNLHLRTGHSHVVLRHAAVGPCVGRTQGSSEKQRSIRVGADAFWQLSTLSANNCITGLSASLKHRLI